MVRTAVLVSGGGTNLGALIESEKANNLGLASLALCVSSKEDAYALTRAKDANIPTAILLPKDFKDSVEYGKALITLLKEEKIELVVLAGFMSILSGDVIKEFEGKIINVHPSLIPSFCGEGFYGLRVHRAVLDYGVKITGATVHIVSEVVDGGKILLQKAVEVKENDTPKTLQLRVMQEAEWSILPLALKEISLTFKPF